MENINSTPVANRFTIGIFGRRNVGKSSLLNAITNQNAALISSVPGTTTDPVYKTMEILPIGPVVFIDTAGLDDDGELGIQRVERSYEALRKCNFIVLVTDEHGITQLEKDFIEELQSRKIRFIVVFNKCDINAPKAAGNAGYPFIYVSTLTNKGIEDVKKQIIANSNIEYTQPSLVDGLIKPGETAVLVTPIDSAAPKGRLILPQQQVIRDILDTEAMAYVTKEAELKQTLKNLKTPPAIVITDSQVFKSVAADTPENIPLTSFSILFARQKADITEMVRGAKRIDTLVKGDNILIVEGCTHHRQDDDIGTVKIPRWINKIVGEGLNYEWTSGANFPKDIKKYSLIIHCGGCMLNNYEMRYRTCKSKEQGVYITNYGVLIAYVTGILPRVVNPFLKDISIF
ncbi:MAG: [FeFe] hydrogenase H-cluster maturation GTPase HydF [Bacteroidales bacterium]|jgi:[FeFe] hydrogenase H-cluster maturation GTPase HydF|nr:[FeFe] hydrogenase H-cluster maturation GTPase HydF [Bacteroidales bacterium]